MTSYEKFLVGGGGVLAFASAFAIGANDVANALATSVGSGALNLRSAVILGSICEFIGAAFLSGNVAGSLKVKIVAVDKFEDSDEMGDYMAGMFGALLASVLWLLIATFKSVPVSTTHTVVGAIVMFGFIAHGAAGVQWAALGKVFASWVLSPVLGGFLAYASFSLLHRRVGSLPPGRARVRRCLEIYPFLVATTFSLVSTFGLYLAAKVPMPWWGFLAAALGCAVIAYVPARVFLVPHFAGKIAVEAGRIAQLVEREQHHPNAGAFGGQNCGTGDDSPHAASNPAGGDAGNDDVTTVKYHSESGRFREWDDVAGPVDDTGARPGSSESAQGAHSQPGATPGRDGAGGDYDRSGAIYDGDLQSSESRSRQPALSHSSTSSFATSSGSSDDPGGRESVAEDDGAGENFDAAGDADVNDLGDSSGDDDSGAAVPPARSGARGKKPGGAGWPSRADDDDGTEAMIEAIRQGSDRYMAPRVVDSDAGSASIHRERSRPAVTQGQRSANRRGRGARGDDSGDSFSHADALVPRGIDPVGTGGVDVEIRLDDDSGIHGSEAKHHHHHHHHHHHRHGHHHGHSHGHHDGHRHARRDHDGSQEHPHVRVGGGSSRHRHRHLESGIEGADGESEPDRGTGEAHILYDGPPDAWQLPFAPLMVATAAALALAHGANDVANAISPFAAILDVYADGDIDTDAGTPIWILILGGISIVIGVGTLGHRVMHTVGNGIAKLDHARGFCAQLATATSVLLATAIGAPVSTTHAMVGAVMGSAIAAGERVDRKIMKQIFTGWGMTLPVGMVISALWYLPGRTGV